MPAVEFGKQSNIKSGSAVKYGIQTPATDSDGSVKQADSTKVKGPKTVYTDRVSKQTVKRAS